MFSACIDLIDEVAREEEGEKLRSLGRETAEGGPKRQRSSGLFALNKLEF